MATCQQDFNMYWYFTLGLFLSPFLKNAYGQLNVTLTTKKGTIVGLRYDPNPATGASYDGFLGIPYGQIPARFQPPTARNSWSDVLVTQTDGPACPQPMIPYFSEDCLYLNVFTPKNASSTPGRYPVMAFIHGSAFTWGSSSSATYGPDFLIPSDVILVTMNYRLGAPGFFTLGSTVAPGNLGLFDTQLALQWIQDEISVFGGDPTQVTLMGQSAGSVMTHFHYLSPISSGLFKQAIAQSGSALSEWGHITAAEGKRRAKLLAQAVNCNTSLSDGELLVCLQKTDINYIVGNQSIVLPNDTRAAGNGLPFVPVIDTNFTQKPFFSDSFPNLLKQAHERAKPLLAGFTSEDGMVIFGYPWWILAQDHISAFIPEDPSLTQSKKKAMADSIRKQYFPDSITDNKILDMLRLYTDSLFAYPAVKFTRYYSNITYGYLFTYDGAWSPVPSYFSQFKVRGVGHGADLAYLFYGHGSFYVDLNNCPSNQPNIDMRNKMVQWWTTFAKTSVPDQSWKPITTGGYHIIDSTPSFTNSSAFESQYYDFWANLDQTPAENSASYFQLDILFMLFVTLCMVVVC